MPNRCSRCVWAVRGVLVPGVWLAALLALASTPACTSRQASVSESGGGVGGGGEFALSPVVAGSAAGLEVFTFLSSADDEQFARALAPFTLEPVPIQPGLAQLWSQHGLRLVSVPITELQALSRRLGLSRSTERQWLGQATSWTEIVSAPERTQSFTIALDAERLRLPPGHLRLLTRAWIVPLTPTPLPPTDQTNTQRNDANTPDAGLTIELVPQHRESRTRDDRIGISLDLPTLEPGAEGLVFSRLLARMTVRAGRAFVLVPERPGVVWDQPAPEKPPAVEPAGVSEPAAPAPKIGEVVRGKKNAPSGNVPTSGDSENAGSPSGPYVPSVATLGDALLRPWMDRSVARPTSVNSPLNQGARTVVILYPRVPERYRLSGGE